MTQRAACYTVIKRETVTLQPDAAGKDGNLMTGKLSLAPAPGMRIVVQMQSPVSRTSLRGSPCSS